MAADTGIERRRLSFFLILVGQTNWFLDAGYYFDCCGEEFGKRKEMAKEEPLKRWRLEVLQSCVDWRVACDSGVGWRCR